MAPVVGIDILRPGEADASVEVVPLAHDLAAVYVVGAEARAWVAQRIAARAREGVAEQRRPKRARQQQNARPGRRGGAA